MKRTSDLVKRISEEQKISIDEVVQQRQMPFHEATIRYLPTYLHKRVIDELGVEPKDPLSNALYRIGLGKIAEDYEKEFRETEEGNLWYECNFPRPKLPNLISAYKRLTRKPRRKTRV